jgi:hypothetical protein
MIGWLKSLFSIPKVTEVGVDLVKRGADAVDVMFYTEEEKAQAKKEWWSQVFIPLEKVLAPQGAIRAITRRILANDFCKTYLFLVLLDAVVYKIDPSWAAHLLKLIQIVSIPVGAIVLFYFGSYGIGTYILNKEKKTMETKIPTPTNGINIG